jgi:hypothetical protein
LLTWLSSTASGIALTAENLTRDFGIEQPRTQRILRALFNGLNAALQRNAQNHPAKPMVDNLFRQWQTFFSQSIDYSEAFGGKNWNGCRSGHTRRASTSKVQTKQNGSFS